LTAKWRPRIVLRVVPSRLPQHDALGRASCFTIRPLLKRRIAGRPGIRRVLARDLQALRVVQSKTSSAIGMGRHMRNSMVSSLVLTMVAVTDVQAAHPNCGVAWKPPCAIPNGIVCQLDYSGGRPTASGSEAVTYHETQQWLIRPIKHVCSTDPTKQCFSYSWFAVGVGIQTTITNQKPEPDVFVTTRNAEESGTGEFFVSGAGQLSQFVLSSTHKGSIATVTLHVTNPPSLPSRLTDVPYEWPLNNVPAGQQAKFSIAPGGSWLVPSSTKIVCIARAPI